MRAHRATRGEDDGALLRLPRRPPEHPDSRLRSAREFIIHHRHRQWRGHLPRRIDLCEWRRVVGRCGLRVPTDSKLLRGGEAFLPVTADGSYYNLTVQDPTCDAGQDAAPSD